MYQEKVDFPCKDIILEGILNLPEGKGPFAVVVVCHPHPLYGGNMNNNVIDAVCKSLDEHGLASLKFNFRGVGRSGGSYSEGLGEVEDVKAAVSYVTERKEVVLQKIGVCGYSFGSMVAFRAAVGDDRIQAVAGISPFVEPAGLLTGYTRPKLFVCGTEDDFINIKELELLVQVLPDPKELDLYPYIDHFWWGHEDKLAKRIGQFFTKYLA